MIIISFKHSYVKAEQFLHSFISNCNQFDNGSQLFESITNSTSLELNSRFGNKFSNNLVVAYTNVADEKCSWSMVQIFDGPTQSIFFGAEVHQQQIF
jgi:hypothetical protein